MAAKNNNFIQGLFLIFLGAIFLLPLERIGSIAFNGINIRISQILVLIVFVCYFIYSLYLKEFKIKFSKPLVYYVLFLSAALISLVFAREKMRGIMVLAFLTFMLVVPYITVCLVDSKKRLKNVIYVLLLSAGVFSLFGLFQFGGDMLGLPATLTGLVVRYTKEVLGFPRIQSTFIEPLYFANYLMIPLFLSIFFVIKKIEIKKNIYFIPYFLFILCVIILTVSKGAYLAIGLVFLGMILFQIRSVFSRQNLPYLLGIIIFLSVLFYGSLVTLQSNPNFDTYSKKAYDIVTGASITERADAYSVALEAYGKSPIIGIGIGNFGPYFSGYPLRAPDFGWPIVNNEYLEILSETGIIGLFFFILFILAIFYYSFKAYKNTHDLLLKTILLALNFAFLGILIQYATFSTLYIMHIWILIGLILALQDIILKERDY